MQSTVTEDMWSSGLMMKFDGMINKRRRGLAVGCCLAMTLAGFTSVTHAQGRRGKFSANVVDTSKDTQSITVPLNRGVIVETTVEVARADVVAGEVANVQAISPKELLVTGLRFGRTNVILWDAQNQQYVLEVTVELDLDRLNDAIRGVDPQSSAKAVSMLGNVVLRGTVSSAERAERMVGLAELMVAQTGGAAPAGGVEGGPTVVNHLDVAGEQQVLLHCTVAEVSRRAIRELGVNGFLAGENFRDGFLVNQIGGINPINIGAAADSLIRNNVPFVTGSEGIPLLENSTLSLGFPRVQTQLFIRALADNQLATVLAEPNLVAISGETASFLSGGEFPIPVPQGNQQVTIQFREFGIRLSFTPIVKAHQRIRMRVAPEVSELDFTSAVQIEGFVVPGLKSRSTETTVELSSGQTIAIAGLLNEELRGVVSRVPGIGDVPVLGALFRSVNFQRSLSELVILVTPEIVAPLDAHQTVALPTDGVVYPDDYELYMLGLLERDDPSDDASSGDGLANGVSILPSQPTRLTMHGPWGHAAMVDFR